MILIGHGQALLLDSYVVKKNLRSVQHEAGPWDPNYTQGVDFLDHDFL
jgi:hypothetical protein